MESQPQSTIETQLEGKDKDFYMFHGVQLIAVNFPPHAALFKQLHEKLLKSTFDAGDHFELLINEETENFEVRAKMDLKAGEDVFIVDHAFSFRYPELRTAITQNEHLRQRLSSMLSFADTKKAHPDYPKTNKSNENIPIFEYDNQDIEDPSTLEIPANAVGVSFWGNNISEFPKLKQALDKLPNVKVLWLNNNPIAENLDELKQWIEQNYTNIQIVNSQFTAHVDTWGVKFANMYPNLQGLENVKIEEIRHLDLSSRNVFHLKEFDLFTQFKSLKSVNIKSHEIAYLEQSNKLFSLMKAIPLLKDIECEGQIYDILWGLQANSKLKDICPTLRYINGYDLLEGKPKDEEVEIRSITKNIWKIAGTYRLATSEQLDETSIWYVLDEFGSGIQNSRDPNCSIKPFLYAPNNKLDDSSISYSIMWLLKDVNAGDVITQDYLQGTDESKGLYGKMKVWYDLPDDVFVNAFLKRDARLTKITEEAKEKFSKPVEIKNEEHKYDHKKPMKVLTDYELIATRLTHKNFEIVKDFNETDIVWIIANLKPDNDMFKGKYINQFPFEACIVMKHYLANTVVNGGGKVKWLQPTYDLQTELNEFIGDHITRAKEHIDNHWIIKPPNMARSLDMVVTDNLDAILRLMETGPRLAQKYIHKTLTFRKKKIDHRFIVLVRSVQPMEVFIYKTFMTRTSNFKFTLDPRSVDNYETHFTIMTYSGRVQDEIDPAWFTQAFNEENKPNGITWDDIYVKIKQMVKELFTCVQITHPEMQCNNARAIYGMDVIVDSEYQPKLLEMTFSPDCKRPSTLNPDFFNDIFNCFFFGEERNMDRVI